MPQTSREEISDPRRTEEVSQTGWRDSAGILMGEGKTGLTLPNWLTLTRIFMLPILVLFLLQGSALARQIAGAIFALAALTDWLDGHLARTRGLVTPLGEILDPLADKLLIMAALLPLVAIGQADSWGRRYSPRTRISGDGVAGGRPQARYCGRGQQDRKS